MTTGMRGTCTNFGTCTKADEKLPIDVPPGGDFKCPECGLSLTQVAAGGMSGKSRMVLAAVALLLLLAVASAGLSWLRTTPTDSASQPPVANAADAPKDPESGVGKNVPDQTLPGKTQDPVRTQNPASQSGKEKAGAPPVKTTAVDNKPPTPPIEKPVATPVPDTPQQPPEPPPKAVVAAKTVTIPRRTTLSASPASDICESSKVGDSVKMSLTAPLSLSDGTSLPAGTPLTGRISSKRSSGNQPPLIEIEANRLGADAGTAELETSPVSFLLNRPSSTGRVIKGAVIGAAAGTALGLVLKKNVAITAGAGAAVGGTVAAATRSKEEACVSLEDTAFVFTLTKEAVLR